MSLWTPSGEYPVDRRGPEDAGRAEPSPASGAAPPDTEPGAGAGADAPSLEDLTPEQRAQVEEMARQMEEAQQRMLRAPSGTVIGQHALQLYELAVLYLSQDPPRLDDGRTAIDGFAAVIERLGDRLGEAEQPLRQYLNQIQLAYVQVANKSTEPTSPPQ